MESGVVARAERVLEMMAEGRVSGSLQPLACTCALCQTGSARTAGLCCSWLPGWVASGSFWKKTDVGVMRLRAVVALTLRVVHLHSAAPASPGIPKHSRVIPHRLYPSYCTHIARRRAYLPCRQLTPICRSIAVSHCCMRHIVSTTLFIRKREGVTSGLEDVDVGDWSMATTPWSDYETIRARDTYVQSQVMTNNTDTMTGREVGSSS